MEGLPRGPTPIVAKDCGVGGDGDGGVVGDGGVAPLLLPALKSLIVTFDCKKVRMRFYGPTYRATYLPTHHDTELPATELLTMASWLTQT